MIKKRWKIKDQEIDRATLALADSLNISNILAMLLIKRDVTTFFEAKKYFRPDLDALYDPYLMDGMDEASKRVIEAITNNQKVCVFGDYDVDGTCSAALMYLFLKELGGSVEVYIPKRLTEGYGLSKDSIDKLSERNVKLMISVDCGITAVEEIRYAKELGIDTIICDHHQPKEKIPDAVAVLDPLKPGDEYPFKYLSGAGVAFKLARAVADRFGHREMGLKYLDLVALAGAADIVALTDENRILVKKGLELINSDPRPGILALIKSSGMKPGELTAGQIVFTIAPRINAVGRLGDAQRAVDLFVTEDFNEAAELAQVLETENTERRKIDEMTYSNAIQQVEENTNFDEEHAIVLHNENWHPGVIGIVASRLVEKYYRPSIMLTTINGVAKGSARSITGFNIYEALEACEDLLVQFGGHQAAAGIAIEIHNLDKFRVKINSIIKEKLNAEDIQPEIKIDAKISLSEISPKFIRVLEQFAPFGPGNMRPVFIAENVQLASHPRIVGTNHLIASIKQKGCDKVFDSIGFNMGEHLEHLDKNESLLDIVFTIEKVRKNGMYYPQMRLKDLRIK